jgi:hypothetical protein
MKNVIEIHTEGKDPEPRSALDDFCLAGAQQILHRALEFEAEQVGLGAEALLGYAPDAGAAEKS